jgi:hypothetical protein
MQNSWPAPGLGKNHWWKKALWSWFVRAIGPGCRTGINNSGPMTVPVPARTGTDRSPRRRARSEGGVGHWSQFVARTGIVDLCRVLCFFPFYLFGVFCIQFNGYIYTAIMKEPPYIYIYYTSWSRIYYSPSHPSCLVETYYKRYSHKFDFTCSPF